MIFRVGKTCHVARRRLLSLSLSRLSISLSLSLPLHLSFPLLLLLLFLLLVLILFLFQTKASFGFYGMYFMVNWGWMETLGSLVSICLVEDWTEGYGKNLFAKTEISRTHYSEAKA